MSLINDLENMITKASALRKQAVPTAAQMDPNYRPANYKPIGSEGRSNSPGYQAQRARREGQVDQSSGGNQQQRQQAMQNPVSRPQHIRQAKQREQQRIQQNTRQSPQGSPFVAGARAANRSAGSPLLNTSPGTSLVKAVRDAK